MLHCTGENNNSSVSPAKSIIANSQNPLYLGGHQLEKQSEVLLGELRSELKREARELCDCRERSRLYPVSTSQGQPAQARARPRISRPTKIPNLQTISSKFTLRLRAISYTAKKIIINKIKLMGRKAPPGLDILRNFLFSVSQKGREIRQFPPKPNKLQQNQIFFQ